MCENLVFQKKFVYKMSKIPVIITNKFFYFSDHLQLILNVFLLWYNQNVYTYILMFQRIFQIWKQIAEFATTCVFEKQRKNADDVYLPFFSHNTLESLTKKLILCLWFCKISLRNWYFSIIREDKIKTLFMFDWWLKMLFPHQKLVKHTWTDQSLKALSSWTSNKHHMLTGSWLTLGSFRVNQLHSG